ncbi:hypothetical protein I5P78_21685 [Serratia marcescens]|nr:hypothetical protein [Serratia marcescens]
MGTTLEAHISAVQNKMIGSCRVPYTYEFVTGKEEICIRLYSRGSFANATTSWLPFFLSSGGACGGVSGGGTLIPPITPPVLPASCSISDSITIGHGSINSASVNGSKASYNARLTCTRPVSVSVVVSNAGVIDLNATGTLSSTVYVAGKKGGNTFNNVSDMSVLFESILSMNDGASVSGKFERSAVVTVSII